MTLSTTASRVVDQVFNKFGALSIPEVAMSTLKWFIPNIFQYLIFFLKAVYIYIVSMKGVIGNGDTNKRIYNSQGRRRGGGCHIQQAGSIWFAEKKIEKIAYFFLVVNIKNQMIFFYNKLYNCFSPFSFLLFLLCSNRDYKYLSPCADLEGGRGGGGPAPPWNLQSLISPISLEMKK